ncbi:MAG: NAD(P)-dependent alcohol dehydrogenase [Blastocatellia bacterium]
MKAIVYRRYGSPDVLKCEEVEKPTPAEDEVLIRVRAASVNPVDRLFRGRPYLIRIMTGLRKPKYTRLGVDVAGQVEAVGRNVTEFKPGDEVFGACRGACAEYVCAPESKLVTKPTNMTFEQAAATPVAALTALQGLRDKGKIQPGQKTLINGAAGGAGTFAVQIAKSFGADVTAVCSTRNVDMVRSIGADHVLDYSREDFTKGTQRYDLIFDLVANHSLLACKRVMKPKGIYIGAGMIGLGESITRILVHMIAIIVLSRLVSQNFVTFMAKINKEDLAVLGELMATGKVTPVIDRCYSLSEVSEAIGYLEGKHARGKIVISLKSNNDN